MVLISGHVFAAESDDLESQLPGFFSDEVREEWLEKQEKKKVDRRNRLRQIRRQRLEKKEAKRFDPEEVLRQELEREALQKELEERERQEKEKFFERQQRERDRRAYESIEEIRFSLRELDKLENELRAKLEGDLERITLRKDFLSEKLVELESGDYSSGVVVTNTEDALDLESRFLDNIMISPTETLMEMEGSLETPSPFNYRNLMREYYRPEGRSADNGKMSSAQKIKQMRSLANRAKSHSKGISRAQKLRKALEEGRGR